MAADDKKSKTIVHINQRQNNITPAQYFEVYSTPLKIKAYSFMVFHLFLMAVFAAVILFYMFCFFTEFRIKVNIEKQKNEVYRAECRFNYETNRCDLNIPYLREKCVEWKNGLKYSKIRYGKVFVNCLSESLNDFINKISWKFFVGGATIILFYGWLSGNIYQRNY